MNIELFFGMINYGKIIDLKGKGKFVQSGAEPKAGAGALDAPPAENLCKGDAGNEKNFYHQRKAYQSVLDQGGTRTCTKA